MAEYMDIIKTNIIKFSPIMHHLNKKIPSAVCNWSLTKTVSMSTLWSAAEYCSISYGVGCPYLKFDLDPVFITNMLAIQPQPIFADATKCASLWFD